LLRGDISAARWKSELAPLYQEMGKAIEMASICGLGRSVPVPLRSVILFFEKDLAAHLKDSL
jgi:NADH:ubiquinone oxidoreductase subunit F (NADH-binding)